VELTATAIHPTVTTSLKPIVDLDFGRGPEGYPTGSDSRWNVSHAQGEYQMTCREAGLWWFGQPPLHNLRLADFICEVTARLSGTAPQNGWGLGVVGGSGGTHPWTGILLNASGAISSRSFDSGSELPFFKPPALRSAAEWNTLRVEAVGARFRVFINGQFVFERQHERLRPDSALTLFSHGRQSPVTAHIKSVKVWSLATGAASVAALTAPPPPTIAPAPAAGRKGLKLAEAWQTQISTSSGGHSAALADLHLLLSSYGQPEIDLEPHPEMEIYPGIKYLAPLGDAEKVLFGSSRPTRSSTKLAAPGFPDGLFIVSYDVKLGIYNRLYLVHDRDQQVVSLELVSESALYVPPSPPFHLLEVKFRMFDYVNDRIKAQADMVIDTRVHDQRGRGYLIVNTTGTRGQFWKRDIPHPGVVSKPSPSGVKPRQTTTWYVPKPIINLILYCVQRDSRK
jgi:hypothetical protein